MAHTYDQISFMVLHSREIHKKCLIFLQDYIIFQDQSQWFLHFDLSLWWYFLVLDLCERYHFNANILLLQLSDRSTFLLSFIPIFHDQWCFDIVTPHRCIRWLYISFCQFRLVRTDVKCFDDWLSLGSKVPELYFFDPFHPRF